MKESKGFWIVCPVCAKHVYWGEDEDAKQKALRNHTCTYVRNDPRWDDVNDRIIDLLIWHAPGMAAHTVTEIVGHIVRRLPRIAASPAHTESAHTEDLS